MFWFSTLCFPFSSYILQGAELWFSILTFCCPVVRYDLLNYALIFYIMFSFFDFYPPGRRIMSSIFTFRFSIWHTRLLCSADGLGIAVRKQRETLGREKLSLSTWRPAASGQSNVHGRGDIQRTTQMRQRHHPFNRTKQFLWGWFNTISSWLVVQCCGSLCGLYSGLYSVLRNSFEPAGAALWSPIAIRSIVATPMCLLGQRLCTLAIREKLAASFPGTSLSFFWTWNLYLGRSHLCSMWVKVS